MLQVSIGQCQTQLSIGQCQFQFSFFVFGLLVISIFRYVYCYDRFQVSSYRYVNLSVSKVRSLERGGVSEPSQSQVDR
jgi:hypothetical protein